MTNEERKTNEERIRLIIDLALTKRAARSPGGISGDIGFAYYPSDGHFVMFHRGDKQAVVHAANKEQLVKHFSALIDEVLRRKANVPGPG